MTSFLKKDFRWILTKDDEKPKIDKLKLIEFYNQSYNEKTGWDKKPGASGHEINGSNKTKFSITDKGFRNSVNKFKKTKYLVFGDSFAFCRYVNDDETWQHYLEILINQYVRNYGVGNYGVDQAIIKYNTLKNKDEADNIILSFVPETILRVHSYWKNYIEFGNKHGFKPKFILADNELKILPNLLKKNDQLSEINSYLEFIKKHDVFYETRFKKLMFKFPFTFSYIRNLNRNNIIFFNVFIFKILKFFNLKEKDKFYKIAKSKIISDNIKLSHKMYSNDEYNKLLKEILINFNKKIMKYKKKLCLVIFPQIQDLEANKKDRRSYQIFYENLKPEIKVIDLTNYFISYGNYRSLYTHDVYGGHLSSKGNKFVANILKEQLISTS